MTRAALIVALAAQLAAAAAWACPACSWSKPVKQKPGVATLDPQQVSKGFNASVFFMLATVYGIPGLLGLALWRTIHAHQSRRRGGLQPGLRPGPRPVLAGSAPGGREARPEAVAGEIVVDSTILEMNAIPVREEAGS